MSEEKNRRLILSQHEEIWSKGNLSLVDQLYASKFFCHSIDSSPWHGPEGVKDRVRVVRTAFPDWTETVEDIIAEDDRIVTRFVCTGTHRAVFLGIEPTGRRVRVAEIAIYRIEDHKIAEQWLFQDITGLHRQLTENLNDELGRQPA
jgi:steroid delta-isomerase-like uncharacterized protein